MTRNHSLPGEALAKTGADGGMRIGVRARLKPGFSLIELLVVILLMGLMATIVVPNLAPRRPQKKRQKFIAELEGLFRLGWQQAVQRGKMHRILFDMQNDKVELQMATGRKDRAGQPSFQSAESGYNKTMLRWPKKYEIRQLYINGVNELKANRDTFKAWFFIMPTGMTQEVILNFTDTMQINDRGNDTPIGLVVNPFTAQVQIYDQFQKP